MRGTGSSLYASILAPCRVPCTPPSEPQASRPPRAPTSNQQALMKDPTASPSREGPHLQQPPILAPEDHATKHRPPFRPPGKAAHQAHKRPGTAADPAPSHPASCTRQPPTALASAAGEFEGSTLSSCSLMLNPLLNPRQATPQPHKHPGNPPGPPCCTAAWHVDCQLHAGTADSNVGMKQSHIYLHGSYYCTADTAAVNQGSSSAGLRVVENLV